MRAVCWRHAHGDLCLQETREGTDAKHSGEKAKGDNALTFLYTGWGCWGGHLSAGRFQNKAYYTFSELCRTDHRNNHHPGRQQRTRETSAFVCLGTEAGGGFSSKLVSLSLGLKALCQEPVPEDICMADFRELTSTGASPGGHTVVSKAQTHFCLPSPGMGRCHWKVSAVELERRRELCKARIIFPLAPLCPLWWDHIVRAAQVIMNSAARIKEQPQALWWGDSNKHCVKSTICRPQRCPGEGHVGVCRCGSWDSLH